MSISKDEFYQVFHQEISLEFSEIPMQESEIEHAFSEEFQRKMEQLLAWEKNGVWSLLNYARKHIVAVVIVVLGVSISACGIVQMSTHLYGNLYDEMRQEFYAGVTATELADIYTITELPEGFEVVQKTKNTGHQITKYKDDRGKAIYFLQDATEGVKLSAQTDQVKKQTVTIRDLSVVIFENYELIGAIWIEDGYFMEIIYYGCEDVEDVIRLVESVE